MKPSAIRNSSYFPYILLFVQPIFMATNLIIARGGVEHVPPISLAFWRWLSVFLLLAPFFLKKVFDTNELGYIKLHAKVFEIDYKKFYELNG